MLPLLLGLVLQAPVCAAADPALRAATAQAQGFDLPGAALAFDAAGQRSCPDARLAAVYLRALQAARDAYRSGGDADSIAPVVDTVAALDREGLSRRGEVVRTVLLAAVAAAQSERDDMALLLTHATDLERRLLAAGEQGAPGVTAHEAAGDLWLQVHRFDTAQHAYEAAAQAVGLTPRVALGLARVAVRHGDTAGACRRYRELLELWRDRDGTRDEIDEARAYLGGDACRSASAR
jgi:tetratricopeptide (TPR) repeat protein